MTPDPVAALVTALETSSKVASSPGFMTVIDRCSGYKVSEWGAKSAVIQQQIKDGYEEAKQNGLGIQYASTFRQEGNLLTVASKAVKYVKEGFQREIGLDEDVFWNLLEHSKTISEDEVQELIAKIIAGEYNEPNTYSMSTLQVLKSLGKNELNLLEKVGALLVNEEQIPATVFQLGDGFSELMEAIGITYSQFQDLQSLGLVQGGKMTTQFVTKEYLKIRFAYFSKHFVMEREEGCPERVRTSQFYELTSVGKQIIAHLNPAENEYYYNWLKENYSISNYKMVS